MSTNIYPFIYWHPPTASSRGNLPTRVKSLSTPISVLRPSCVGWNFHRKRDFSATELTKYNQLRT